MVMAMEFDASGFLEMAKRLDADEKQVPYALATLLNDAAFAAKRVMTDSVWPSHVNARNNNFLSAALHVDKATKTSLTAVVRDQLGRGNLYLHTHGGVSTPMHARSLSLLVMQ
jgi:hypothetical protein